MVRARWLSGLSAVIWIGYQLQLPSGVVQLALDEQHYKPHRKLDPIKNKDIRVLHKYN